MKFERNMNLFLHLLRGFATSLARTQYTCQKLELLRSLSFTKMVLKMQFTDVSRFTTEVEGL